jgi:NADPH2:quinone reductase
LRGVRALVLRSLTGPDGLTLEDVPPPDGAGVHIDVAAAVVSFADLLITRGEYQARAEVPFVPGLEAVGVVRAAPPGCGVAEGDRVVALTLHGAFAERVVARPERVFPLPDNLDFPAAAGLAVNYQSVWFALIRRARLQAGERVLVHGAGGGVGTAAIGVAKAAGAFVVGAASSAAKRDVAVAAGADAVIDPAGRWAPSLLELTGGAGADVVIDPVGGERFDESIRALAPEGRLVVVGFAGGPIPQVKVNRLLLRNVSVMGAAWREFLDRRPDAGPEAAADLNRWIAAGQLVPPSGTVLPLERGAEALRALGDRTAQGKLVLEVSQR